MTTPNDSTVELPTGGALADSRQMYLDFFKLKESPFPITPDPEFLFLSTTHQEALDKIIYGLRNQVGFAVLTGEVGTGKTTICRHILDHLAGQADTVYLINPSLSGRELLSTILDDLGVSYGAETSKKALIDHLNRFLLSTADSRPVVIVIDDAQTMAIDALEDLRLLSNLETDKRKLLQVVLVGQPELLDLISRPELRQLKQRVVINSRLDHIRREELAGYIARRLFVAGAQGQLRFTGQAIGRIYSASRGIPRLINKICDFALVAAYVTDALVVERRHVRKALRELGDLDLTPLAGAIGNFLRRLALPRGWKPASLSGVALLVMALLLFAPRALTLLGASPDPVRSGPTGQAGPGDAEQQPSGIVADLVPESARPAAAPALSETGAAVPAVDPPPRLPGGPAKYVVQLGSYRTLDDTLRAVAIYASKGIESHWHQSEGTHGKWYRLFTGRFRTFEEATEFQRDRELNDALVLSAPWSVAVGPADAPERLSAARTLLLENGYDGQMDPLADNSYRLLVGIHTKLADAKNTARHLGKLGLTAGTTLR